MNTKKISLLVLFIVNILYGQSNGRDNISFWGGYGIGLSFVDRGYKCNSFQYNVGLRSNNRSLKIIVINNIESIFKELFNSPPYSRPNESLNTQSFLLGFTFNIIKTEVVALNDENKEVNFTLYSGLSLYQGIIRGNEVVDTRVNEVLYNKIERSGIGFPLELELEWRFNNYCGVTVNYHMEINSLKNIYAIQSNFIVGYF